MSARAQLGRLRQIGVTSGEGAHQGRPLYHLGAAPDAARAVVILAHGRGASAQDILALAPYLAVEETAFLAPQASGHTWYPHSFLSPRAANEPYLTSALATIEGVVAFATEQGMAVDRVVLAGFSQGACLVSEFAARNPTRYGAVIAFSGGVIGPLDEPLAYEGDLMGTPVFLGCSDVDAHIPLRRVEETAQVFEQLNARVTKRIYPGMGHTVNEDELYIARELIAGVANAA